jgi:biotin transport system permease protein
VAGKLKSGIPRAGWSPFCYRAGKTILHRAPAGLKLLGVMALSTIACFSIPGLAAVILLILAASITARIPPWELLKGSRTLALLSLCIMLLNFHTPVIGIVTVLRIFVPFIAAALLFSVTTMRELRLSLAVFEKGLRKMLSSGNTQPLNFAFFSLGISLMLGFIPRFFELWETANLACDARVCKRGLRRLIVLVPLVTEHMMETAADTALAIEARGLGQD